MKSVSMLLVLVLAMFPLLSKTTNGNQTDTYKEETICLSMNRLISLAKKNSKDPMVKNLAYINFLEGYVLDTNNQDIILIGKSITGRPSITLDDLVINIRNVWNNMEAPYCSLDPLPGNIVKLQEVLKSNNGKLKKTEIESYLSKVKQALGNQITVIHGVPRNSKHAHIMIDADYIMKKYSQGLMPDTTVKSYISIMEDEYSKNPDYGKNSDTVIFRFWFHIAEGQPKFKAGENTFLLDKCDIVVSTEKQLNNSKGELYDAVEQDPIAAEFALSHSNSFSDLEKKTPEYAYLDNLFRLQAILRAIDYQKSYINTTANYTFLLNDYMCKNEELLPGSLPCLVNYKVVDISNTKANSKSIETQTNIYCPIIAGGVSMEMPVNKSSFEQLNNESDIETKALLSKPRKKSLTWKF